MNKSGTIPRWNAAIFNKPAFPHCNKVKFLPRKRSVEDKECEEYQRVLLNILKCCGSLLVTDTFKTFKMSSYSLLKPNLV